MSDIQTAENGKYVTFRYIDGSYLTIKRDNNKEDVKAEMKGSWRGGYDFTIQGSNAYFSAGKSITNVNVPVMTHDVTIDTSNGTNTNINIPKINSGYYNIKIIPDEDVKKDTVTKKLGIFSILPNKVTEISEETVINPR